MSSSRAIVVVQNGKHIPTMMQEEIGFQKPSILIVDALSSYVWGVPGSFKARMPIDALTFLKLESFKAPMSIDAPAWQNSG